MAPPWPPILTPLGVCSYTGILAHPRMMCDLCLCKPHRLAR